MKLEKIKKLLNILNIIGSILLLIGVFLSIIGVTIISEKIDTLILFAYILFSFLIGLSKDIFANKYTTRKYIIATDIVQLAAFVIFGIYIYLMDNRPDIEFLMRVNYKRTIFQVVFLGSLLVNGYLQKDKFKIVDYKKE